MSFEHKVGSFTLFKNDKKEKDTQPDYRGEGKDLDGNDIRVSAWIKEGKKGKFMSCKIETKSERVSNGGIRQDAAKPAEEFDDSEIPF